MFVGNGSRYEYTDYGAGWMIRVSTPARDKRFFFSENVLYHLYLTGRSEKAGLQVYICPEGRGGHSHKFYTFQYLEHV
jgi:hypothetical protein